MAEQPNRTGHETRDAPARLPLYAMLAAVLFIILSSIGLWALLHGAWQQPAEPPSPFAQSPEETPGPGGPALEPNPASELNALNRRMNERLNSAGWIDREVGIVHMPIDQAMDLLVERGLPAADTADDNPSNGGQAR